MLLINFVKRARYGCPSLSEPVPWVKKLAYQKIFQPLTVFLACRQDDYGAETVRFPIKIPFLILANQFDHFPGDGAMYVAIRTGMDFNHFAPGIANVRSPGAKQEFGGTRPHSGDLEYSARAGFPKIASDIRHSEIFLRRLGFHILWCRGLIFKNSPRGTALFGFFHIFRQVFWRFRFGRRCLIFPGCFLGSLFFRLALRRLCFFGTQAGLRPGPRWRLGGWLRNRRCFLLHFFFG